MAQWLTGGIRLLPGHGRALALGTAGSAGTACLDPGLSAYLSRSHGAGDARAALRRHPVSRRTVEGGRQEEALRQNCSFQSTPASCLPWVSTVGNWHHLLPPAGAGNSATPLDSFPCCLWLSLHSFPHFRKSCGFQNTPCPLSICTTSAPVTSTRAPTLPGGHSGPVVSHAGATGRLSGGKSDPAASSPHPPRQPFKGFPLHSEIYSSFHGPGDPVGVSIPAAPWPLGACSRPLLREHI